MMEERWRVLRGKWGREEGRGGGEGREKEQECISNVCLLSQLLTHGDSESLAAPKCNISSKVSGRFHHCQSQQVCRHGHQHLRKRRRGEEEGRGRGGERERRGEGEERRGRMGEEGGERERRGEEEEGGGRRGEVSREEREPYHRS